MKKPKPDLNSLNSIPAAIAIVLGNSLKILCQQVFESENISESLLPSQTKKGIIEGQFLPPEVE